MDKIETLKEAAVEAEAATENLSAEVSALEGADEVDKEAVKAKKAELRTAQSSLKKANAAVEKEHKAAAREEERAAKKAAKEAEKAEREAAKEAAKEAKAEEAKRKEAEREANRMPEQNGIRRPKPNTKCGRTWEIADEISKELGQPAPIKELLERASKEDLNEGNTKAEYARWRKFNGVTGRVTLPKEETAEETAPAE